MAVSSFPQTPSHASTRAVHAGLSREAPFGSATTPLFQTTTFAQRELNGQIVHTYSRASNPTVAALETALSELEGLPFAAAFNTGMSAITTLLLATTRSGDHVVCGDVVYGGTRRFLEQILPRFGVKATFVDASNLDAVSAALRPETKHVIVETPANPTLKVCDIGALSALLSDTGSTLVVDNTFLTSFGQDVVSLGADIVVYSTTKFVEGHNSALGGAVLCADRDLHDRLVHIRKSVGTIQSPNNAWLTLRGLKTLPLRLPRHSNSALAIAEFLLAQPAVAEVHYPWLQGSPGYQVARRQQRYGGGVVAAEFVDGYAGAVQFCQALRLCLLAENLGATETIVTHPASMTHGDVDPTERERLGIRDGLIRISVGLEDPDDIVADISDALEALGPSTRIERHAEEVAL